MSHETKTLFIWSSTNSASNGNKSKIYIFFEKLTHLDQPYHLYWWYIFKILLQLVCLIQAKDILFPIELKNNLFSKIKFRIQLFEINF
jgi:hypothetical protein